MNEYLTAAGFQCPDNVPIADHMLHAVSQPDICTALLRVASDGDGYTSASSSYKDANEVSGTYSETDEVSSTHLFVSTTVDFVLGNAMQHK